MSEKDCMMHRKKEDKGNKKEDKRKTKGRQKEVSNRL